MHSANIVGRIFDETGIFSRKNTYEVVWSAFAVVAIALLYANITWGIIALVICGSMLVWELQSPNRKAMRLFNKVGFEYQCGKYEEAVGYIEQALDLNPDHKAYNSAAAYIKYVHLKDYESAKENIQCCLMRNPCPEFHYILADCHFKTGLFSSAIQLLKHIEPVSDIFHECGLLLAKCYIKKGNPNPGMNILRQLIDDSSVSEEIQIEARYWLGYACFHKGNFKAAREQLAVVYTSDESYRDTKSLLHKINKP